MLSEQAWKEVKLRLLADPAFQEEIWELPADELIARLCRWEPSLDAIQLRQRMQWERLQWLQRWI